ncbi:MAG: Gldg family protein [Vallitaleaceae bacterium]|jgi:ABC-2 type transport system permease protein|nr:Gldg family protein [Vallitaleaceae bacterium]
MKGWINKENKWPMGKILFTSMILLLVLTMLLVNIVAVQLEKRFSLVGDLTANAAYKVGPETSAVLQSLPKDVHIYVLAEETSFTGEAYLVQANLMMKAYPAKSNRVTLSYIDYVLDPTFASQYSELVLEKGDILVTSGENTELINLSEMFNYERNLAGNVMIVSSRAEEVLTSAILRVMSDDKIHVAVLKGNGVANKSDFNDLLNENGFVLEDVNMVTDPLDDRYDIAMLLAPQIDLSEAMISKIDEFLYNDGAYGKMLIYTADVTQDILPMTEAYLKEWGIQIGDGAVFETKAERTYQSQPFYPVVDYEDAYYSDLLIDSSVPIIMPLSRPIEALFTVRDKHFTKNLLIFGATSGVRPSDTIDFNVDEGVSWGGNPGLVLASIKIASTDGTAYKQSDILVSASSEMLEAFTIGNTSLGNSEYIIKLLKDSFGKEQSVAIVPKSLAGDILTMNTRQKNIIAWTMVGVIPICILVTGIAVFAMRRYK